MTEDHSYIVHVDEIHFMKYLTTMHTFSKLQRSLICFYVLCNDKLDLYFVIDIPLIYKLTRTCFSITIDAEALQHPR